MANASAGSDSLISLPKSGGALHGIGEKFSPDLHTGTGNFTVPIALPPGRAGLQPQLNLVYSTGHGNGCFGQGWSLDIPGVSRRTAKGVPRFDDTDVFIVSGVEDLVRVAPIAERTRYRPRTEGLFALIERVFAPADEADYWEVRSKEGLTSVYGTLGKRGIDDPAAIGKDATRKLAWKLTETRDPFGSRIVYSYGSDEGLDGPHRWKQPLLSTIEYAELDDPASPRFLVSVSFDYEDHPEPFSDYRGGFEIRTTKRCSAITVWTHFDTDLRVRQYKFTYRDDTMNGAALLSQIEVIGFRDDDSAVAELPPLTFDYTVFDPRTAARRDLIPIAGADLPGRSLADRDYELIDLTGDGLPDVLEMNGVARYWRNVGGGRFDLPRTMRQAPPLRLADPGVQMLDADGDGRADLMVTAHPVAGYYALSFDGEWEAQPRRRYQHRPSFSLDDPEVRLLDLDGDGVTDALRSGARFECFFNDPTLGWHRTEVRERKALDDFPDVNFSDPRVRLADMTGSGLQDIVLIHDSLVEYWPNLGNGHWGARITMRGSPRFADPAYSAGYDPRRILLGDADGDGLADLIYVGDGFICLWINKAGNGWSAELVIDGTPRVSDMSAVRLADMLGTGIAGVLWSADAKGPGRDHYFFLDLTGGIKPYLLDTMDNHIGAVTRVEYASSTRYYLEDQQNPATRWRTHLPFPVQVVSRVEVIDAISRGKLTTEYRYHHGYWDGREREFRGFGMVEQLDTETFDDYHRAAPLHGDDRFARFDETPEGKRQFSPPTLTRTWFHVGACEDEATDLELDLSYQYFGGDPALLDHKARIDAFLAALASLQARRGALRALRGSVLRSEVYARDDDVERQDRPYTVTESAYGLRLEEEGSPPSGGSEPQLVFFSFVAAQRTTQWERGDDPMTRFTFSGDYDAFGQPCRQTTIAMPRRAAKRSAITGAAIGRIDPDETRILATHTRTQYADPPVGVFMRDRVAQTKTYELSQASAGPDDPADDARQALRKQWAQAQRLGNVFADLQPADVKLIGHKINHYDGPGFEGAEVGTLERFGVLTRTEVLALTDQVLRDGYASPDPVGDPRQPAYLRGTAALPGNAPAITAAALGYRWRDANPRLGYEAGYYADTLRRQFDCQDGRTSAARGVITATQDPLRHQTDIAYDAFDFLSIKVTDPARLERQAAYDYRHLQPISITDANGNWAQMRYSPLGLPLKQFVQSRDDGQGRRGGDESEPEIAFSYDFTAFETRGEPICVRTRRRVHHASDGISDETIETREYSDGFGRLVQARRQAEDAIFGDPTFGNGVVPLSQGDPGDRSPIAGNQNPGLTEPNVVVSGWQVFDNKGRVVEKFEPYFDGGWDYKPPTPDQLGQRTRLFYDPRGQVIRTVNPDGSEQRVIFGVPGTVAAPRLDSLDAFEPTPWENYSYDGNDLASATSLAGRAPVAHYFTPASARVDALGRVICQVARNGPNPAADWFVVRSAYDVRGNLLQLSDAFGRQAFAHAYDLLNRSVRTDSIDAGLRTAVLDAAGNLVETRDSRGSLAVRTYDPLNRRKQVGARDDRQGAFTLRERIDYGDEGSHTVAIASNSLGKPSRHADEAGVLDFLGYDFKGNLTDNKRRVIADAALAGGWVADWSDPAAERALDATEYVTSTRYDALNRAIETQYPADVNGHRAHLVPFYNRAGALERVTLDGAVYVERIAYNARGQRTLVAYGNGMMTRYGYDAASFRLARLLTEDYSAAGLTYGPTGDVRQDFAYGYDLAGNMLTIDERVKSCGVRNSTDGADRLVRRFDYDPVYRLTAATGRACGGIGTPRGLDDDPRCGFFSAGSATASQDNAPDLTEAYTEAYRYDPADNLKELSYSAASGNWTRALATQLINNRLKDLTNGATAHAFGYDANGNLIQQNTERHYGWDHADRLASFRIQPAIGPASVQARYLYGADGIRVKKWVRRGSTAGNDESTTYIDDLFEHCRWTEGSQPKQNNRLQVRDDRSRIAIVRIGDTHADDAWPNVQYHLADHLGGSHLVIGGDTPNAGTLINREEYFPYGETSFGSFAKKRYRYTGRERDEESGSYYHGARYYAPWLGRWLSTDPKGPVDGPNLYQYVGGQVIDCIDDEGTERRKLTSADFSKWSQSEVAAARSSLMKSGAFKELQTDPQIYSYSPREEYGREIRLVELKIDLEVRKQEYASKRKLSEQERNKIRQQCVSDAYLIHIAVDPRARSPVFRLQTYEEWGGGVRQAKGYREQNAIVLFGKEERATVDDLIHDLAHESAHLFDPETDETEFIKGGGPLIPFVKKRDEIFAELFAQLILCEIGGAKNCHVANLKYGADEIKLDLKTQKEIDAIYTSGKSGKEKAAAINDLVKSNIRKE